MKVIIAGGKGFDDYELLKEKCDKILCNLEEVVVVSGRCKGADFLGEKYVSNS